MFYDVEKIKEDVTPMGVIKYLNKPFRRSGRSIYIECPVHKKVLGKADRHISNCVLNSADSPNAFYCYGCRTSGSVFQLIAGYLDLDFSSDFRGILKVAADSCGGEEYYALEGESFSIPKKSSIKSRLSANELDILDLYSIVYQTKYIAGYDSSQLEDHYQLSEQVDIDSINTNQMADVTYLETACKQMSIGSLGSAILDDLTKAKAREKMSTYKELILNPDLYRHDLFYGLNVSQRQSLSEGLKNVFRIKYIQVRTIYLKVASGEEIAMLDDSWLYGYESTKQQIKPGSLF